jgi:hypothetical protein
MHPQWCIRACLPYSSYRPKFCDSWRHVHIVEGVNLATRGWVIERRISKLDTLTPAALKTLYIAPALA